MKKLTVGSLVYDDFDGIYFSYQSIRLNNLDILDELDLIVIDNNPTSKEGLATKDFCEKANIRYETYTGKNSTGLRNQVFAKSEAPHTVCMDPHVMFEPETIKNLLKFYSINPDGEDLYQGPMLMDCLGCHDPMTHMDPVWRSHMYGTWAIDKRGITPNLPPFEIPMHGLGMFSCKTDKWLGFNENFIGFGGEEGYIHDKYKLHNRTTWCLPFFRWLHRFGRPRGVPYELDIKHRIHNYIVGFKELGKDLSPIYEHFTKEAPGVNIHELEKNIDSYRAEYLAKKNGGKAAVLPLPSKAGVPNSASNVEVPSEDHMFTIPTK